MSRELMSFPIVYPVIFPVGLHRSASSGSGTDHFASERIATLPPCPTTRLAVALKKSSGRSA
jgi:hypothetical protein